MGKKIWVTAGKVAAEAELNNTSTARAIWEALPMKGRVNLWGDEIYFSTSLHLKLEAGQEVVNVGDLGYWPDGNAFCIFFGPTPASQRNEVRPASPVTVFGKVIGDAAIFRKVSAGAKITISRWE